MNFREWLRFFLLNDDSSDLLGKYGEDLTARKLKWTNLFGYKGLMLRNVYIPAEIGETTEIDLIYITQKGLFIIESKNVSGWIFGRESDRYWTESLPDKSKHRFFNPIWQNRGHIKWLREFLHDENLPCFSLIVFSERCELKKLEVRDKTCVLIHRDELISTIRSIWNQNPDVFDEEGTKSIYDMLSILQNADEAMKQAHVDRIHEQYHGTTCPSCGSALVLRTTKSGANAERQFYGCSAFPKCRYVRDTEGQPAVSAPALAAEITPQSVADSPALPVPEPESESAVKSEPEIAPDRKCPRCGAALVLRTAKKGDNAGKQFYGCSAFPKCRYIQNKEET